MLRYAINLRKCDFKNDIMIDRSKVYVVISYYASNVTGVFKVERMKKKGTNCRKYNNFFYIILLIILSTLFSFF